MFAGVSRSSTFARTVWVAGSARGENERDRVLRDDLAVGVEDLRLQPDLELRRAVAGTWIYASSPAFSSIVVITVELVKRSPSRIAMSPTNAGGRRGDR
jgi:hypothetical protein